MSVMERFMSIMKAWTVNVSYSVFLDSQAEAVLLRDV